MILLRGGKRGSRGDGIETPKSANKTFILAEACCSDDGRHQNDRAASAPQYLCAYIAPANLFGALRCDCVVTSSKPYTCIANATLFYIERCA